VEPGAPRKTGKTRTAGWAWIFSTLAMAPRSIEERRAYFFKKNPFHNPQLFTLIEFQPQRQNQHPRTMKTVRYLGWFSHMWHNRAHMSESTSPALLACLLSFPDLLFLVTVTSAPSRRTAPPLPEP
jgi:hypothetical protein